MTGARILLTAARQLKRNKGRYALVSLCIGVGQGYATILRNPEPISEAFPIVIGEHLP